ncbi:uncharacterized protein Ecym_7423 [Eremothecium cymbalariae DBVPG|uniref:Receptor L-domain domain-containing protein n=1 Tax=Eremothecium cymbalariae (strain CBS 270.75 / DBVPG 7215 / KCTC 17166 / NRRL Y-17582) TaxID=931890 RepID=G8JWN1_ERECY|nr:hypothetical protein Ecym_7423 [Eremothecium cymbalariae DBVPG\
MQYKIALTSAALLIGAVQAQNSTSDVPSSCSIEAGATAVAQADLDKYSKCEKLVGDLLISGTADRMSLANVQEIDGSLTVNNATKLVSFSADSLQSISKSLNLRGLTVLEKASFGSLEEVSEIDFTTLPAVSNIITKLKSADKLIISDTNLESIDGFESLQSIQILNINNNKALATIRSQLKSVSNALDVSFNGRQSNVTFDNLQWANNITMRDVNSVSLKSLEKVNSSMSFLETSLEELKISNLTSVGGTLTVTGNDDLSEVDFPSLTGVSGALVVANNSNLEQINGFSNVQTVGNALIISGKFNSLDLDNLKSIKGGAQVETTSSNFTCDALKALQKAGGIQGDTFVCKNGASSTSMQLGSGGSGTASGQSTASSTDGAKSSGIAANFAPGSSFMGAVAAVAVALL